MIWGAILSICVLAFCVTPNESLALGYFDPRNQHYLTRSEWALRLSLLRGILMCTSVMMGCAIGWFLSPQAKETRLAAGILLGLAVAGLALVNGGVLGWSATGVVSLVGFFAAIGYWIGQSVKKLLDIPTTFGSSHWAREADLDDAGLFGDDGIILGEAAKGETRDVFSYKGDRHLITVAPTRAWKGVSHIIPNLLMYQGSVFVIDTKGENAMITANARRDMGQRVLAIDPWGISGEEQACFNPLDWIANSGIDAPENAMLLADALVQKASNNADPFWTLEAKALLQGLILHVSFDEAYDGLRNLGTMRDLLLYAEDDMQALFQQMVNSPHQIVASCGARSLQKEPKLMANVLASAQAETHFLDSDRIRECLSRSDFSFAELKTDLMSIYLILPPDRLDSFGRFLRLLVQQAITENARHIDVQPRKPVLFILDEMPALGRLTMIEQAYGLMAGYGIQLWGICQDLCQLRKVYGPDYETFIGNSGVVAYFGSPDKTSAEYFSALCGVTTVWNLSSALASGFSQNTNGTGNGSHGSSTTYTDNRAATQRKLAYPDELMRLPKDRQLILIENTMPIMAAKIRWFEHPITKDKGVNLHADT
ncbi:type IV secretory system conjugative DNA transfer family protein [Yoonia sp. I 8.24]|nr:type IV secretory system conjugative DNA transfer family protein [Yoonia sp. I 8.24]